MTILAIGINHDTAPVEIREKVAFPPDRVSDALRDLVSTRLVNEAAILSTCNRTEIYCGLNENNRELTVIDWLKNYHNLNSEDISPFVYSHPDRLAVRHMLRVASGLDSLVLGEPQILGQLKQSFSAANDAGTIGKLLGRLFQHTFSVAKQVRTDTAIGESPVSVAFAAVSLAKQIFSNLENHTALLIGAGETIELTARHLKESGIGRMIIANRTVEKAQNLANELHAYAIPLAEMPNHLAEADIVISSTASNLPILGKGATESALKARKHRPMLMVDIAVPRDIEPEVDGLDDVYLYTVDDLREIIQEGLKSRQAAAEQAEEIIDSQVIHFMGWLQSLGAVSTICAFRESAEQLAGIELKKAQRQLANGVEAEKVIQQLARNLTNKLIHVPSVNIKQAGYEDRTELIDAAVELFNLKNSDN
ncbi:MAG: glutamyl-tRNA reductase [Gammaproteobacteria bacterium]|nr:glutamyl-tRNA reductase [Gammaproteobacteria bacterium]